ncbi:MAG: xanthine dehydrogenase FAD-binding subunit XdhB [Eubacteriales bacterium]|nr:xanthine dehydrogenase FAD-binding subunit XdhB [Eubacteriales bacterium]
MYDIKSFYEAASVQDAIAALCADENAEIISGGTDLLIRIREGKAAGKTLVSIHNIPELKGITYDEDGTIVIGAATSFSHLTNHEIIKKHLNMLGEAVDQVGGPQIRNAGTIGGNICNGATSADSAASMQTLNAIVVLEGPEGLREVPVSAFYTGPGKTVRSRTEVCTAFKITKENYEGWAGHYIKYGKRNAMEIATLGCAVWIRLSPDKQIIEDVRLAYGVAAPTPIRCRKAEYAVRDRDISDAAIYELLSKNALEEVSPRTSWRASREFRLQLISELGKRALKQAIINAGGKTA